MSFSFVIESSFCLILLYSFYWLLLRKNTYFQWNRIFLLLIPFVAFVLPLISNSEGIFWQKKIIPIVQNLEETGQIMIRESKSIVIAGFITINKLLLILYYTGVILLALKLLRSLFLLVRVMIRGKSSEQQDYYLIEHNTTIPMSSFFQYIFWDHPREATEQKILLEHELVHVRQYHSIDRLWMEIWKIIFWFNPFIHYTNKRLRETHEYIADSYVTTNIIAPKLYAQFLAEQSKLFKTHSLVNNFYSLTRNRLIMIGLSRSGQLAKLKFILIIPLLCFVFVFCSLDIVETTKPAYRNANVVQINGEKVHLSPIKVEWGSIKKEKGLISLRTFKRSCQQPIRILVNEKYVELEKLEINVVTKSNSIISLKVPKGIINPKEAIKLIEIDEDAEIYLENILIVDDLQTSKRIPNVIFQIKNLRK